MSKHGVDRLDKLQTQLPLIVALKLNIADDLSTSIAKYCSK